MRRLIIGVASATLLTQAACFQDLVSADGGSLAVLDGDRQIGVTGGALPSSLRVRVVDQDGLAVPNRSVTFTVESGNGTVSPATVNTDRNGVAKTSWTLGSGVGEQRVQATVDRFPTVSFRATATFTLFDIDVRFLSTPTQTQRVAFDGAATRWRTVVTGELSDVPVSANAGQCGANSPTINETIDDLVIYVTIEAIDGEGGSLGQAGPCFIRTSNSLPLVGQMRLDVADLAALEQTGNLRDVILHEMGHVLGVGTLWVEKGFLADPVELGGTDPHFTGPTAVTSFDTFGGAAYIDGEKVPVEDSGGSGTSDGHWRESVLHEELMTGFLNAQQPNPLSAITVGSLEDLGYGVNAEAADTYMVALNNGASVRSAGSIVITDDVYRGSLYRVSQEGRLVLIDQRIP